MWLDRTGGRRLIEWAVGALPHQDGHAAHAIAIGNDVTETRELERLKSQFVSMVSHELRTPLTSIRASMQLMLAESMAHAHPESNQLVQVALSNADRLIRIVNDILDMSKIEAGELTVTPRRTAAGPIVGDAIRAVEGVARDAEVSISVPVMTGLPDVLVDADRTVQVLVNLLSNAVKHAPSGSSVEVTAAREGATVAIAVRDHGPGIPRAKLDFIFEPFTQLDGSDTRRIPEPAWASPSPARWPNVRAARSGWRQRKVTGRRSR